MRRIPLSRRSHVVGFRPLDGEAVEHESALERDFVLLTRFLDSTAVITAQPVTITFESEGRTRRYTPDFRVLTGRGSELVEIKYRADLRMQWKGLRPAFEAARRTGERFRIVTESAIRGPLLDNARRLLPLRDAPLDGAVADRIMATARSLPAPTFGAIVSAVAEDRAQTLGAIWRLIARGLLLTDLTKPVLLDSLVRPL